MEKHEYIDQCPSFERLNQSIEELKNSINSILNELEGEDEDGKKMYIIDYITENL